MTQVQGVHATAGSALSWFGGLDDVNKGFSSMAGFDKGDCGWDIVMGLCTI